MSAGYLAGCGSTASGRRRSGGEPPHRGDTPGQTSWTYGPGIFRQPPQAQHPQHPQHPQQVLKTGQLKLPLNTVVLRMLQMLRIPAVADGYVLTAAARKGRFAMLASQASR